MAKKSKYEKNNTITIILVILIVIAIFLSYRNSYASKEFKHVSDSITGFKNNSVIIIEEPNIFNLEIKSNGKIYEKNKDYNISFDGRFVIKKTSNSSIPNSKFVISYDVPEDKELAALVNKEKITFTELSSISAQVDPYSTIPTAVLLKQIINEKLVTQEIANSKISVPESEINATIQELTKNLPQDINLKDLLASQNITMKEFREEIENKIAFNMFLERKIPELKVNDTEIIEFYNQNKESLTQPEQVRASHILICFQGKERCETNLTKEGAQEIVKNILEQIKKGADFRQLALQYSTDPSVVVNGGDLGYFSKGQMVKEFEEVAFTMQPGQVSMPIETIFGYHIIYVTDKKEAFLPELDQIKSSIKNLLFTQKIRDNREKVDTYLNNLTEKAEIKISELLN